MQRSRLSVPVSAAPVDRALLRFREALGGAAAEVCSMAGITAADVGSVVLVGGSSLMRVVSDEVRARFPKAEMRASEPFTAVVDGLALASSDAAFG